MKPFTASFMPALISGLGEHHPSQKIINAIKAVGGGFVETPSYIKGNYYFEFFSEGIQFNFESEKLVQITLYLVEAAGYKAVTHLLFEEWAENKVKAGELDKIFGSPVSKGGGEKSTLLGYVNKWKKYALDEYEITVEMAPENEFVVVIHFSQT